ncbi:hypothetical protein CANTEDRAFT_114034 [Yamadazyma tenuis ATCC 10573]|uniref:Uncharacterized protein n=1 Tax=Candida tenuis (strain ATCC 10573 / BCRC 21748 / CBS 615 / JCM 9827 / NBRC 10315 / NRRL Y-1498 / VKM Y-70) TaxID=590646 RepID=G3B4W7_CANTC|nr:uncharacterized protein CANTEDRAFT_114034 [Yamadazyma tenuis ATCC 10573]EGV64006.1 hypothetical protein CANTEDRAFT_114034 [Yamadazyma tenuis ATCC 10573]
MEKKQVMGAHGKTVHGDTIRNKNTDSHESVMITSIFSFSTEKQFSAKLRTIIL